MAYDKDAVWQGKRGALPLDQQLWPKDDADIRAGRWPQYYVGAYPSCFQLPVWNGQATSMGQSPGTHWYHAHKHGSTALNLANGLAGALIIEGDYDDKLKPLYDKGKEVVMVLQQYAAQVNLMRAPGTNTGALVFGERPVPAGHHDAGQRSPVLAHHQRLPLGGRAHRRTDRHQMGADGAGRRAARSPELLSGRPARPEDCRARGPMPRSRRR